MGFHHRHQPLSPHKHLAEGDNGSGTVSQVRVQTGDKYWECLEFFRGAGATPLCPCGVSYGTVVQRNLDIRQEEAALDD